jgi:hypothetical protein
MTPVANVSHEVRQAAVDDCAARGVADGGGATAAVSGSHPFPGRRGQNGQVLLTAERAARAGRRAWEPGEAGVV